MTTKLRETKQNFEGDASIALPPLQGLPGVATVSEPQAETLVAEYYDSEDLRLLLGGVTLRRREGGADEGWYLKLPDDAAAPVRGIPAPRASEVRMSLARGDRDRRDQRPAGGDGHRRPASQCRVSWRGSSGRTREEASLRPVARIETRRRRTTLRDADGGSLAEIAVDEVAAQTFGRSTTVLRWNEVEVELTGGGPRLAAGRGRARLRHQRPASSRALGSKLERVLAARLPARADGKRTAGRGSGPGEPARRHRPARSSWLTSTPRPPAQGPRRRRPP